MKKSMVIAALLLVSLTMYGQTGSGMLTCLSPANAEKIIGQPAKLMESKSETKNGILEFRCMYTAKETDGKTGKLGNLYYRAVQYQSAEQAHDTLARFHQLNRDSPGWKKLPDVGDEAIVHTDKTNFQLVMIRKGNKLVIMKVNKVTAFTATMETSVSVVEGIAAGM